VTGVEIRPFADEHLDSAALIRTREIVASII
jgi:hypothetical protein